MAESSFDDTMAQARERSQAFLEAADSPRYASRFKGFRDQALGLSGDGEDPVDRQA